MSSQPNSKAPATRIAYAVSVALTGNYAPAVIAQAQTADLDAEYRLSAAIPADRRPVYSGRIVIVVGPPPEKPDASDEELDAALKEVLKRLSPSRAAAEVATTLKVPRKRAYARALELSR